MTTQAKKAPIHKDFFPTNSASFMPLLIVYRMSEGLWKGFVSPYGETTEGSSKTETLKKIRALASAYKEISEEYGNPRHLVYPGIGDIHDREVISKVTSNKEVMDSLHESGHLDTELIYVEAYRG